MTATVIPAETRVESGSVRAAGEARRPFRFSLARLLGYLALLVVLFIAGAITWVAWGLPEIDLDRPVAGKPSITLESADGAPIAQSGGTYLGPVERADIPDHLINAVLAIEDRRFYEHFGVDPSGIVRAAWRNYQAGDIVQGGSTITQQLAKVLFLSPEQTFRRKLQEALIAGWLDVHLSKDEILTKYLDSVYFGAGATGVSAAAKVFFDRPVSELTLAQSAMLAGIIRAPSKLNPITNPKGARERTTVVLNAMVESDFATRDQAIEAALNPAMPVRNSQMALTGSWYGDWITGEATAAMGPLVGTARIRTTLQPAMQAIAERTVQTALSGPGKQQNVGQAALVAMDYNGAVLAMVGGASYQESQFNRAVDAMRQPGSAFKTFVYLAALRAGRTPESIIPDKPVNIEGWQPKNFSGRYYGKVSMEQAFARSLNAATVTLAQEVGIQNVIKTAHDLGIDAELSPNLTLSLGTAEMSLLDITGAYASIAAGRTPVQPWGIAGLSTNPEAEPTLFRQQAQTTPLAERDAIVQLLTAVVDEGTGTRAALDGMAAGKTGTSQNYRDAWFIGFTDKLIVGVWVGNDDNSPMKDVTGGRLPAEIWRNFVVEATGAAPDPAASDVPVADDPSGATDEGVELAADDGGAPTEVAERSAPEPAPETAIAPVPAPARPAPAIAAVDPAPPPSRPEPVAPAAGAPVREAPAARPPTVREPSAARRAPAVREAPAAKPAKPKAVVKPAAPAPKAVARAAPKAERRAKAQPRTQAARPSVPVNQLAPVINPPGTVTTMRGRLAQNRALAEEYAARRRAAVEGRVRSQPPPEAIGGPTILRRARGLP